MEVSMMESRSKAKENLEAYFNNHDVSYITENAVFTDMSSGKELHGRKEIGDFLHYMYHIAFEAKAEVTNKSISEDTAVYEFNFMGKHIGEFAGIQPTSKQIDVPMCVVYDLKDGYIAKARIYMLMDKLMTQLK